MYDYLKLYLFSFILQSRRVYRERELFLEQQYRMLRVDFSMSVVLALKFSILLLLWVVVVVLLSLTLLASFQLSKDSPIAVSLSGFHRIHQTKLRVLDSPGVPICNVCVYIRIGSCLPHYTEFTGGFFRTMHILLCFQYQSRYSSIFSF